MSAAERILEAEDALGDGDRQHALVLAVLAVAEGLVELAAAVGGERRG